MDRLQQFVADVESVGTPSYRPSRSNLLSRHMLRSYLHAGVYGLIAVFVLLYIDFQSVRTSLLAMLPLAIGCLVTAGLIGWLDIALNPANMIVMPLLLGIGVDDGVHLVHEYRRSRKVSSKRFDRRRGDPHLHHHDGQLRHHDPRPAPRPGRVGAGATLGVLACLVASILVFPALLGWMSRPRNAGCGREPSQPRSLGRAAA